MSPADPARLTSPSPARRILPCAVILLAAAYLAAPHLSDEIWYDEAFTLEHFAGHGPGQAFIRYDDPNNHILFSSALALWRPAARTVFHLRLLPLAAFLIALALTVFAVTRLGGETAGLLAGAALATSHVALNFAAQLRGYGPSCLPVAAALLLLPMALEGRRWLWSVLYVLAAAVAVGIVPTNLTVFAVFGAWALGLALVSGQWRRRRVAARLALIILAPLAGAACYIGVWSQVVEKSRRAWTSQTVAGVFGHWARATLVDVWWLLPLAAVGALVLIRTACTETDRHARSATGRLLLAAACLLVPPAAYALAPSVPFPRTLVPLLPAWYAALALLTAAGLSWLLKARPAAQRAVPLILVAALLVLGARREWHNADYTSRNPDGARPQNLYDQYYHHQFFPSGTADALRALARRSPCIMVTDNSDLWALRHAVLNLRPPRLGAPLYHESAPGLPDRLAKLPPSTRIVLVTCSLARANALARRLGLPDTGRVLPLESTGFFKLFIFRP